MRRLVFILTLLINVSYGQELSVKTKWGREFTDSRRSSVSDIVGFDGTGIYVVKRKVGGAFSSTTFTLEHFSSSTLLPTKSLALALKEDGRSCDIQEIIHWNDRLYVFYSYTSQKKNNLFVKEIDKTTLSIKEERLKIGEIDYTGHSRLNRGDFNFRVSRDSSRLLVFYDLPYSNNEPEAFGFHVLDEQMKTLWEKNVKVPYKDDLFDVESFRIDNDGNVYLLGLIYKDKRKSKRRGQPNYSYEVQAFSDKGNTFRQYPVSLQDKFLSDMQIEVQGKNLVCAGFYSETGTYSIKGTYFLKVDLSSKEITTRSFKEFGMDFITQGLGERDIKRVQRRAEKGNEPELVDYDLDKLLVGRDGSAILIGEQYSVQVVTSTSYIGGRPSTTTTHYYNYDDILVVKIAADGQIEWAQKVPKTQRSINDGGFYLSYTLAITKGKICFIYNDSPQNLTYKGSGAPVIYTGRPTVVMMVSLNQKGEATRQALFNNDLNVIARPKVCEQISNSEVILFGQRKKKQQFARIIFE